MNHKLICIVGMCGSGKSEVTQYIREKYKLGYIRFGQVVIDEILRQGRQPSPEIEKEVREQLRKEHGMAVMAKLSLPKLKELITEGSVVLDGLYSWQEYKLLEDEFGDDMIVLAVYAPPRIRYDRLERRASNHPDDPDIIFRSVSRVEARKRDFAEIESMEKGGPIAMADYTVSNLAGKEELFNDIDKIINQSFPSSSSGLTRGSKNS